VGSPVLWQCFNGGYSYIGGGFCAAPCTSPPAITQGRISNSGSSASSGFSFYAYDEDLSTTWAPFSSGASVYASFCTAQTVSSIRFHVNGTDSSGVQGGYFYGRLISFGTAITLYTVPGTATLGWNTANIPSDLQGPYVEVGFKAGIGLYPVIAEIQMLGPLSVTAGSCASVSGATPALTGDVCIMTCAVNNTATPPNGDLIATCDDGSWSPICTTCFEYVWQTGNWGTCYGGQCGLESRPWEIVGTQARPVDCVRKVDGAIFNNYPIPCDYYYQPDNSRSCTTLCPAPPNVTGVVPYEGAVEITYEYTYLVDPTDPINSDYVDSITFVSSPGDLEITVDAGYLDRLKVLFYGLDNGVTYTFQGRATTWNGQYSVPGKKSASVTPQVSDGCYYSCQNGATCEHGLCDCAPGYLTNPLAINKGDQQCNVIPTVTLDPLPQNTYAIGDRVDLTYTVDTNFYPVALMLFEDGCQTAPFCVPLYVNHAPNTPLISLGLSVTLTTGQIFPRLEANKKYFFRLWLSDKTFDDGTVFTVTDPNCIGITCLNGGTCYDGLCECPLEFQGTQTCAIKRSPCDLAGNPCSIYGTCNDATGHCDCDPLYKYSGDMCQYPPSCSVRCDHGSLWNAADVTNLNCQMCVCIGNWIGDSCSQCGLDCQNGGSVDGDCFVCTCPQWWTGYRCETPYITATIILDVNPDATPFSLTADKAQLIYQLQADLAWALNLDDNSVLQVHDIVAHGNQLEVTLWFVGGSSSSPGYTGDIRITTRNNLETKLNDPTSDIHSAYIASRLEPNSLETHDPPAVNPSAGASGLLPSLMLLSFIMALATLLS